MKQLRAPVFRDAGMGMGLSISKSIIDAHGGRMGYEDPDGGGARFYFELPAAT